MQAPPLLVSFSRQEDFLNCLAQTTRDEHEEDLRRLINAQLPPITSIRCLAVLFGYSPKFVGSLISKESVHYRTFSIKKGKKIRTINAPKVGLKAVQKWLGYHLQQAVEINKHVHGFVPSRSYLSAAEQHVNANWVYSIDIKDFFQTTCIKKVKDAFLALNYTDHGATLAASLCCYERHLAQGSPASPIISNLIFNDLDTLIANLAQRLQVTYTRYADDLVFSGKEDFPEQIKEVKNMISDAGWGLSSKKEHLSVTPNRLKVHGLLVHNNHIRLTKGYRNKIRAFEHLLEKGSVKEADLPRLKGHVNLSNYISKRTEQN